MAETMKNLLGIGLDTQKTTDEVLEEFRKFFRQKTNIIVDRVEFWKRNQQEGESFLSYLKVLKKMAKRAELDGMKEEQLLVTKITHGIRDQNWQKKAPGSKPVPRSSNGY